MPPSLPAPHLVATIDLPGSDGRAHVIVVPTDYLESTRCVIAVGPNGQAAVACAQRGLDSATADHDR